MESENVHHHQHQHQLQDQFVGSSSSSFSSLHIPPCYGVSSTHSWTPTPTNLALNTSEFNANYNGTPILHSRQKNEMILESPELQDWSSNNSTEGSCFTSTHNSFHHDRQLAAKLKDEELSESITRFTEILSDDTSSVGDSHEAPTNYIKNINGQKDLQDLSEKLLFKTISSGFPMFSSPGSDLFSTTHHQNCSMIPNSLPSRGNFSQIYPSINISNLNQASSSSPNIPSSMNLDLLSTPARLSSSLSHPSYNDNIYKESPSFGLHRYHHFQQSNQRPAAYSPSKISDFPAEITEAKRWGNLQEAKATEGTAATKKSRLDSRVSCPPFKIRKEKLGDRIVALQQLVAPFGKTDTASVLMEAIGYIKFLQNQVETLSVPYMKSSRNKRTYRSKHGGSTMEDGNGGGKGDLRSRGLCLVPLSCMSYMTNDSTGGGGGIWPPPNF